MTSPACLAELFYMPKRPSKAVWKKADRTHRVTGLLGGALRLHPPEYWTVYRVGCKERTKHNSLMQHYAKLGCSSCGKYFRRRDLFFVDPHSGNFPDCYCLTCVMFD